MYLLKIETLDKEIYEIKTEYLYNLDDNIEKNNIFLKIDNNYIRIDDIKSIITTEILEDTPEGK